jgi:hypothetical protein
MSGDERDAAPFYKVKAGRGGSREYYLPDAKPGDAPIATLGRRKAPAPVKRNGRPRALTDNEALRIIVWAHTLKSACSHEASGRLNVGKLARETAIKVFHSSATAQRIEHTRQLIRILAPGFEGEQAEEAPTEG